MFFFDDHIGLDPQTVEVLVSKDENNCGRLHTEFKRHHFADELVLEFRLL